MSGLTNPDHYSNPPIQSRQDTIYKNYSKLASSINLPHDGDLVYIQQPVASDYPNEASWARFPVMVHCPKCSNLALTEVEYEFGKASYCWCITLLPILCTGACCLCLTSCKDVKHTCGSCHQKLGTNQSKIC